MRSKPKAAAAFAGEVFKPMRRVKRKCPPHVFERLGRPHSNDAQRVRTRVRRGTMTTAEYLAALKRLRLSRTGETTSEANSVARAS